MPRPPNWLVPVQLVSPVSRRKAARQGAECASELATRHLPVPFQRVIEIEIGASYR